MSSQWPTSNRTIFLSPFIIRNETALDFAIDFEQNGLSMNQLIELHTKPVYTVSAIGFAPGLCFSL